MNVDLKVGFACNNDCFHCVVADKRRAGDLTYDQIIHELEYYFKKYTEINLVLTGGEFTYRPDFLLILDALDNYKKQGKILDLILQTNGRALVKPELAQRCAKTIDYFLVAIHGHTEQLHDKITGQPGSFAESVKGIQNLIDVIRDRIADVQITSQTVINKLNYSYLPQIFRFLNEFLDVRTGNITFPHPMGHALSTDVVPTYREIYPYLNEAVTYCLLRGFLLNFEQLPLCVFKEQLQKILHEKIIKQSKSKKTKNIVGTDFGTRAPNGKIDYNKVLPVEYKKNENCALCSVNEDCLGIWKEYLQLYPNQPWQINLPAAAYNTC